MPLGAKLGLRPRLAGAALLIAAALSWAPESDALIIERIVAVVGDRPILLSELKDRGRPFLVQIHGRVPAGPARTASESQMYKDLIEKLVDEELVAKAADKANLVVTSAEVDGAFQNIAAQQRMTVPEVFKQAWVSSGITEQSYRDEIRRQLLEGKMLQLRVRGRVRITEEALRSSFERARRDERKVLEYRPAWVVFRIMPGSSPAAIQERRELAQRIADEARAGADFAELASKYSDDSATRGKGGELGIRAPHGSPSVVMRRRQPLAPPLEKAIIKLDPGGVTDPIPVGDAIVVVKLVDRQASRYTTFDAARAEMVQRVQGELLVDEKKKWLEELRRKTHVDIRL